MEQCFMSRTSAVALLVQKRRAIFDGLKDKAAHEMSREEQTLKTLERLLLDVRIGRIREFDIENPMPLHIIISD
jgi:hypothetical protein